MSFLPQIFDSSAMSPHGVCLLWQPALVWLHVIADALIGFSYYSIPLALMVFRVRRPDIQFGWIFWLFAAFIMACGTTHFMSIWTLWHPDYGVEGLLKAFTALVSVITALLLWPLLPRALAVPSTAMLSRQVEAKELALSQLQESEDRYRELYNRTPGLLFSTNEQGRIMEVSDDWLLLLGYQRQDVVGRSAARFMSQTSADYMIAVLWHQFLETGELREIDLQFARADGGIVETLLSARIQTDEGGHFDRVYAVVVDITARRAAELALDAEIESRQRLREMLHQAQKMEAVGQLTGGVAHDFNNLLTAINSNLDLLSRRCQPEGKIPQLIEAAQQAVQRGAKLTKQLLSFSRRQVLRPEIFNLASRFDGLQTLLSSTLQGSVVLEIALAADLWNVMVDPIEFDLAIINLCVNARDAMKQGGTLRITGRNIILPPGGEREGSFVRLAVADTGEGIPPETLARVFEPFFTTKEPGKGTGLGLSQVYGFATQSGGQVRIDSTVGQGTTVSIDLPQAGALPVRVETPKVDLPARLSGHILLVEDDDDVACAAMALIEDLGFTVEHFSQPLSALQRLEKPGETDPKFDLLFSDIVMPGGMNGLEFAKKVQDLFPTLPIILTTGHSQAAAAAGSEFFILPKPYSREQLVAVFANSR